MQTQKADLVIENILVQQGENGITEKEIKDYIISTVDDIDYRTSYFYENCEDSFYESCRNILHYEILKWCGCGRPEEADLAILDYLNCLYYACYGYESNNCVLCSKSYDEHGVKDIRSIYGGLDDVLLLCLMYTMDAAGLTDHGSSIYGAWLTTKGYVFRLCLRRWKEEQGYII